MATTLFFIYLGTLTFLAIAGWLMYAKTPTRYRPVIYYTWALFGMSVIEAFFHLRGIPAKVYGQVDAFVDISLVALLAWRWDVFKLRSAGFWIVAVLLVAARVTEQLLPRGENPALSWFDVASYLIIVLIALALLSKTIINGERPLLKNPIFLFCTGLIFFYALTSFFDISMLIVMRSGTDSLYKVLYGPLALGIFTNIIYLRSLLCIPLKKNYSFS